jgi:hypothetical protein
MYDVRTSKDGVLVRQRLETLPAVSDYLRSVIGEHKLIGVFELSMVGGNTTSREIPCLVEGDLVVLGKPM